MEGGGVHKIPTTPHPQMVVTVYSKLLCRKLVDWFVINGGSVEVGKTEEEEGAEYTIGPIHSADLGYNVFITTRIPPLKVVAALCEHPAPAAPTIKDNGKTLTYTLVTASGQTLTVEAPNPVTTVISHGTCKFRLYGVQDISISICTRGSHIPMTTLVDADGIVCLSHPLPAGDYIVSMGDTEVFIGYIMVLHKIPERATDEEFNSFLAARGKRLGDIPSHWFIPLFGPVDPTLCSFQLATNVF